MREEEFVCKMNINGYEITVGIDDYGQQYFFEYVDNKGELQEVGCGAYNSNWKEEIEDYFNYIVKEPHKNDT